MPATTQTSRQTSRPAKARLPTPRRFLRCLACGTIKKARSYALCAECYTRNDRLARHRFMRLAREAEREAPQHSYRVHPEFDKACRIYARRRERAKATAGIDARVPRYRPREADSRGRYAHESYDGLGGHDLNDLLDWQTHGVELPDLGRSGERAMSDAEIARWDAEVDAWAEERGRSLADEPAAEIHPWGYWMEIDGAMVWTDDVD